MPRSGVASTAATSAGLRPLSLASSKASEVAKLAGLSPGAGRHVPPGVNCADAAASSPPAARAARQAASSRSRSPVITRQGYGGRRVRWSSVERAAGRASERADDPDHLRRVERLGEVSVDADLAAAIPVVLLSTG